MACSWLYLEGDNDYGHPRKARTTKARHTRELPANECYIRRGTASTPPGLIEPGQLLEVQDVTENWRGLCLSTGISANIGKVTQSIELERHYPKFSSWPLLIDH
ncbi:hypothetical protein ACH42_09075 [Endozoicomonas sp. (ex Bugula neritina AB1)]|nr:hypothetical protein ACH42_09075 [Endozoicomonas sp. (ex Bugula neritina AB1)]